MGPDPFAPLFRFATITYRHLAPTHGTRPICLIISFCERLATKDQTPLVRFVATNTITMGPDPFAPLFRFLMRCLIVISTDRWDPTHLISCLILLELARGPDPLTKLGGYLGRNRKTRPLCLAILFC